MSSEPRMSKLLFQLVVLSSTAFVVTILAMVAVTLGESNAPISRLFDRHSGTLIVSEVVLILVSGVLALAVDRRQSLRGRSVTHKHEDAGTRTDGAAEPQPE